MIRRFRILLLALVWTSVQGQSVKGSAGQVIFSVKKTPVPADEFIYLYRKNYTRAEDYTEQKIEVYLNLLINFKLKVAEAKSRGLDTAKAFIKEFNTYKEELKKPYRAEVDDLDRLTRQAYQRLSDEVKAEHILITVKPDAPPADTLSAWRKIAELRSQALHGADFEKLAREFSEDPSAKSNGGNLGYFTALQMVYRFEDAAYNTHPGDISGIVRTRFGYHIVKVLDRRPAQGEVEVSHILLRAVKGSETKIKNTIFEIYDQLKGGRAWDELVREYSEDSGTKNAGGRLRPFGVGAIASVPEFERVAFSLKSPGDYSDPFQSNYGWHIIRLERKIPLQPYSEMEATLKRKIARDERMSIVKMISLENRKKGVGFAEEGQLKDVLLASADSSLIKGKWHFQGPDSILGKGLFTVGAEKSAVQDWVNYIYTHQTRSNLSPAGYMNQLYNGLVEEKLEHLEEQKMLNLNPDLRRLLNEYREGILLFEIMEREVWNKASEDTTGQRRYYAANLNKFNVGNRIEARILAATDKATLTEIQNKIVKGDTLRDADLKKLKSLTKFKVYERSESEVIDQVNWVPGLQETELKGVYYLVEVSRLVPPGTKSFEEARAGIISGYQDALEKEWLRQLRQKFPVHVNKKVKSSVIAELRK